MQRQSLGSPSREKLVISTDIDDVILKSDERRRDSSPSSFSVIAVADDGEFKTEKSHRSHSPPPENFIHFIPILIVFCFLVLYLSSHDPSPQDLAQFHGFKFKHPEAITEMNAIDEEVNKNNKQLKRSKAFAIRSLTNLQEEIIQIDSSNARSHRKLGDF